MRPELAAMRRPPAHRRLDATSSAATKAGRCSLQRQAAAAAGNPKRTCMLSAADSSISDGRVDAAAQLAVDGRGLTKSGASPEESCGAAAARWRPVAC
eukprot:4090981-Pyramimonas_sp.AAC.1